MARAIPWEWGCGEDGLHGVRGACPGLGDQEGGRRALGAGGSRVGLSRSGKTGLDNLVLRLVCLLLLLLVVEVLAVCWEHRDRLEAGAWQGPREGETRVKRSTVVN